jgi:hypothetical protein
MFHLIEDILTTTTRKRSKNSISLIYNVTTKSMTNNSSILDPCLKKWTRIRIRFLPPKHLLSEFNLIWGSSKVRRHLEANLRPKMEVSRRMTSDIFKKTFHSHNKILLTIKQTWAIQVKAAKIKWASRFLWYKLSSYFKMPSNFRVWTEC